jgi:hypothetical protein
VSHLWLLDRPRCAGPVPSLRGVGLPRGTHRAFRRAAFRGVRSRLQRGRPHQHGRAPLRRSRDRRPLLRDRPFCRLQPAHPANELPALRGKRRDSLVPVPDPDPERALSRDSDQRLPPGRRPTRYRDVTEAAQHYIDGPRPEIRQERDRGECLVGGVRGSPCSPRKGGKEMRQTRRTSGGESRSGRDDRAMKGKPETA